MGAWLFRSSKTLDPVLILISLIAGLGTALVTPALSAFCLDISPAQVRARILGIKGSAQSLGGVLGPLLVVVVSGLTTPQGIFIIAGLLLVVGVVSGLPLLREPHSELESVNDVAWEVSHKQVTAAQASLRGLVVRAAALRDKRMR